MTQDEVQTRSLAPPQGADFLSLAETLSSLIALIQGDEIVYVNPAGCRLLGYPPGALVGRRFFEVVHPEDREQAKVRGRQRQAGIPQPKRLVERLVHADGSAIWMDYSVDLIQVGGRPTTLVTGHDVTQQRRVEEELRRSETRLAEAQQIAHIGSWEWDIPGDRLAWSDELCRIYGIQPAQFGGTLEGYLQVVHPEDRALATLVVQEAVRTGGPFAFEHRVVRPDGTIGTIAGRGEVFLDAAGVPVRAAGTGQDITERRAFEEELRRSEERFRLAFTHAAIGKAIVAPDRLILQVNPAACRILGFAETELAGRDAQAITFPADRPLLDGLVRRLLEGGQVSATVEARLMNRAGGVVWAQFTATLVRDSGGQPLYFVAEFEDVTERKRASEALRESEERYRALVEHAPEAIMVLDVDQGRFVDANAHAETLFGWPRERLLRMGPLDFCSAQQADGRASCEVMADEQAKVLAGGTAAFEFTHVDANGREIVCATRLARLPAAGRRLIRTTITDITEVKQLQEKVRHAERLAAVGALAAGVAHEIGNPLMALSMAAQGLERRANDDYARSKLALIREHIDRISRIVRQMSDLARPRPATRTPCDVNQLARRAVDMIRHDRRAQGAEVHYELAPGLPLVPAIEDDLVQVCINLALNAFDAMAGNGPDQPRRLTVRSAALDGLVRVAFHDTGPGVPRALRGRLFEPFFTTKEAGRGSGLGLSVSFRILAEHGGRLWLEDDGAVGATFAFELPAGAGR